jgi:hypothetical protein
MSLPPIDTVMSPTWPLCPEAVGGGRLGLGRVGRHVRAGGRMRAARQPQDRAGRGPTTAEVAKHQPVAPCLGQSDDLISKTVPVLVIKGTGDGLVAGGGVRVTDRQASGLQVSCQFVGESDDLSDVAAQTAYRVVQESVTNAVKHAPGAPIGIVVRGRTDAIEVEISNRPPVGVRSGLEGSGGGHGLVGMRERLARCGGTLDAGPTADRGWRVAAGLPRNLPATAPPDAVPWP